MICPDDVTAGGGRTILNKRNWGPCAEDATANVPIGEDVGTEVEMGRVVVVVIRPNFRPIPRESRIGKKGQITDFTKVYPSSEVKIWGYRVENLNFMDWLKFLALSWSRLTSLRSVRTDCQLPRWRSCFYCPTLASDTLTRARRAKRARARRVASQCQQRGQFSQTVGCLLGLK